jgi:hypothetical protein
MYSSFKKQKLLTESWRKFLKEASEEEIKNFGNWIDENYLDSFSKKVSITWHDPEGRDIPFETLNDGDLIFLGNGSFRATYAPKNDEDYVIKFAFGSQGFTMNKREFELQQDPSGLFPKVFKHSDNFSWIVMEKMSVITDKQQFVSFFGPVKELFTQLGDSEEKIYFYLIEYFINPSENKINPKYDYSGYLGITNEILSLNNESKSKYNKSPIYINNVFLPAIKNIVQSLGLIKGTEEQKNSIKEDLEALFEEPEQFTNLFNLNGSLKDVGISLPYLLGNQLIKYIERNPLINKIKKTVEKYGIARAEIRANNTGVNSKGEFKIIDASVREDINSFMNQPLNPTAKAPSTMAPIAERKTIK